MMKNSYTHLLTRTTVRNGIAAICLGMLSGSLSLVHAQDVLGPMASATTSGPERSHPVQRSKGTLVKDFFAEKAVDAVNLTWTTPQETNLSEFMIERTVDGQNFSIIGKVAAKGNSLRSQNYTFVDDAPINGFAYYCLSSVDVDGKRLCWGFVETQFDNVSTLQAYPNPARRENMKIEIHYLAENTVDWQISDLKGNVLVQNADAAVIDGQFILQLANHPELTPGLYVVHVKTSKNVYTHKIFVNE